MRGLLIDCGGNVPDEAMYRWVRFGGILRSLRENRCQLASVGRLDLVADVDRLRDMAASQGLRWISANVFGETCTGAWERLFEPYALLEASGRNVAFIGLVSGSARGRGLRVHPPLAVLSEVLKELQGKANAVVVVGDLDDRDVEGIRALQPAVHAVLGRFATADEVVLRGGEALGFAPSLPDRGRAVGKLSLTFSESGACTGATASGEVLRPAMPEHAETAAWVETLTQSPSLPFYAFPQHGYAEDTACKACHATAWAQWEGTAHARAYETLREEARIRDGLCVSCHVSGEAGSAKGVGCQACHGPGAQHIEAVKKKKTPECTKLPAVAERVCGSCHNEDRSPRFVFDGYRKKIVHTAVVSP